MRFVFTSIALAAMTTASAQTPPQPLASLLRTHTSFNLVVKLPLQQAALLFGPEGERAWAGPHWNPEFLYPRPGRDVEGAVFTIGHGPIKATWVNTSFDLQSRHFQYVYFIPDLMVTVIDVHFSSPSAAETGVHVDYVRTALTPDGNDHVQTMTEGDRKAGNEWQHAIDDFLAHKTITQHP